MEVIRALLRAERVTHRWHGQETEVEFLDPNGLWYDIRDVPVWMAAGGPKGLKAAAALADAVVYCLGPQPDMIQLVRRELDKAVAEAGRPPGSVKLISLTWFYLLRNGQTWEDAVTEGFGEVSHRGLRGGLHDRLAELLDMLIHEPGVGQARGDRPGATRTPRTGHTTWRPGPSTCAAWTRRTNRSSPRTWSTTGACTAARLTSASRPS